MSKLITPEMVEKAMKEFRQLYLEFGHSDETAVRAALSAVLPDIIEECAKVAEGYMGAEYSIPEYIAEEIATAIRALGKE